MKFRKINNASEAGKRGVTQTKTISEKEEGAGTAGSEIVEGKEISTARLAEIVVEKGINTEKQ